MAALLQKRAEMTRKKILEAAINDFSSTGPSATTVEQIAGSAGVNKQRIYAYFGSKQGLFEAALAEVFSRVKLFSASALKEAAENPEHLSFIVLRSFFHVHRQQPHMWRLLAWANLDNSCCVGVLEGIRKEENESLKRIFDSAVKQKLIMEMTFENWLFTLLALSCFYYANQRTLKYTLDSSISMECRPELLAGDIARLFSPAKSAPPQYPEL